MLRKDQYFCIPVTNRAHYLGSSDLGKLNFNNLCIVLFSKCKCAYVVHAKKSASYERFLRCDSTRKDKTENEYYSKRQNDIRVTEIIKRKKKLTGGNGRKGPYLTEVIRETFIRLAW